MHTLLSARNLLGRPSQTQPPVPEQSTRVFIQNGLYECKRLSVPHESSYMCSPPPKDDAPILPQRIKLFTGVTVQRDAVFARHNLVDAPQHDGGAHGKWEPAACHAACGGDVVLDEEQGACRCINRGSPAIEALQEMSRRNASGGTFTHALYIWPREG